MNRYASPSDFMKMSLPQLEKTLEAYFKIAEGSNWDITPEFQRELSALTSLAKAKGSTKKW